MKILSRYKGYNAFYDSNFQKFIIYPWDQVNAVMIVDREEEPNEEEAQELVDRYADLNGEYRSSLED